MSQRIVVVPAARLSIKSLSRALSGLYNKPMKTILITGASRGIGAAIALEAAKEGYQVCINYHENKLAAEKVATEIRKFGNKTIIVQADVSKERDVQRLFNTCDQELGRLSALVNNAGITAAMSRLEDMATERIKKMFEVNTIGAFLCAKEAIIRMSVKNGGNGGAIVNISSVAAKYGSPETYIDYAASKAAIDTMTIGLAKELAKDKIRVNSLRSGFVNTDIHQTSGDPNRVEKVKHLIPMQRGAEAYEIANSVMWLLSEKASYVSGALLDVSGGL